MIITIDGLSGTGKSSQSRELAKKIGFKSFNTGAVYRTITFGLISKQIDPRTKEKLIEFLNDFHYSCNENQFFFNGLDVTDRIATMEVAVNSSYFANIPEIRQKVKEIQKEFGHKNDTVMEGRDTGSRIFPFADLKIFLQASPEIRAKRKFEEQRNGKESYEGILEKIQECDRIEMLQKVIVIPENAVIINTDYLSFDEVNNLLVQISRDKIREKNKIIEER